METLKGGGSERSSPLHEGRIKKIGLHRGGAHCGKPWFLPIKYCPAHLTWEIKLSKVTVMQIPQELWWLE